MVLNELRLDFSLTLGPKSWIMIDHGPMGVYQYTLGSQGRIVLCGMKVALLEADLWRDRNECYVLFDGPDAVNSSLHTLIVPTVHGITCLTVLQFREIRALLTEANRSCAVHRPAVPFPGLIAGFEAEQTCCRVEGGRTPIRQTKKTYEMNRSNVSRYG